MVFKDIVFFSPNIFLMNLMVNNSKLCLKLAVGWSFISWVESCLLIIEILLLLQLLFMQHPDSLWRELGSLWIVDPPLSVDSASLTDSRGLSYLRLVPTMFLLVRVRNKFYSYTQHHKFTVHVYREEYFVHIEVRWHRHVCVIS